MERGKTLKSGRIVKILNALLRKTKIKNKNKKDENGYMKSGAVY